MAKRLTIEKNERKSIDILLLLLLFFIFFFIYFHKQSSPNASTICYSRCYKYLKFEKQRKSINQTYEIRGYTRFMFCVTAINEFPRYVEMMT